MTLPHTQALPVKCANHFGNIEIKATIEDLDELGICFGDSVTVELSNGFFYHNIPYYNSFLGPGDKPCLYGMAEAYDYVGIGYPVTGNPWDECGATDDDCAIIHLSQKGKFADELDKFGMTIQSTMSADMSTAKFANFRTAEFANFRPLAMKSGASTAFFRCANPLRADTHCSHQAMDCLENLKPNLIINLSDTLESIDTYCQDNPGSRYAQLREENAVIALHLGVDFTSAPYAQKVAGAFSELVNHPAPFLIHCRYGVDRTGFLCALIEALAGTPRHAIARDYMASYENVYGIVAQTEKYQAIQGRRFGEIESYLSSLSDVDTAKSEKSENSGNSGNSGNALTDGALHYLLKGGMQPQDLKELQLLCRDSDCL